MTSVAQDILTQALIDRYDLVREIGRGGMATVYLAADRKHDRRVAIKVMRPEVATPFGTDRFLREVRLVARLQHPHILTLYDSGEAGGQLYFVIPSVEGDSLRDRLSARTALPLDETVRIVRQVADAVDYAHERGVVHRDLKPESILLMHGQALLADFGIAHVAASAGSEALTEIGVILGNPKYMSPEQAAADPTIDGRSDVYSLGCVTFVRPLADHLPPRRQACATARSSRSRRSSRPASSAPTDIQLEDAQGDSTVVLRRMTFTAVVVRAPAEWRVRLVRLRLETPSPRER